MRVSRHPLDVATSGPGGQTNAYLVSARDGDGASDDRREDGRDGDAGRAALLVDPAARSPELDAAVAEASVEHVAVTHTHPDHVGAVAAYAAETDATVWARRPERFREATGVRPDRALSAGTTIPLTGASVDVVETPGHAADHVAFETPVGTLVGDVAFADGSVAVVAPEGDMRAYLVTLRRLYARNPSVCYPGHGPAIEAPRATFERLLRHRLRRERRVLAAVEAGAETLDEVVDGAYEKSLDGVRAQARGTVRAHLEKLAVEGRVAWDPVAERASSV